MQVPDYFRTSLHCGVISTKEDYDHVFLLNGNPKTRL